MTSPRDSKSLQSILKITEELWKRLYTKYASPQLEYQVQVWNLYAKMDVKPIGKAQRRDTKDPHSLKQLIYEKRLKILNLTTLEVRKERGDIIKLISNRRIRERLIKKGN